MLFVVVVCGVSPDGRGSTVGVMRFCYWGSQSLPVLRNGSNILHGKIKPLQTQAFLVNWCVVAPKLENGPVSAHKCLLSVDYQNRAR